MSAEVTHNHPEGIKGAQAAAIFFMRHGKSKNAIEEYKNKLIALFFISSGIP